MMIRPFVEYRWKWVLAAIVLVAVGLHTPLFGGSFIGVDDVKQILGNRTVTHLTWENFKEVTFTNFLNRNHNPMYASFILNWALTPHYMGFVAVNLAWLAAMILAFFCFAGAFIRSRIWQLFATALFAAHSVHVDIIAWMSARCHLMGIVFFLLAFVAWQRYRDSLGRWRRSGWYFAALVSAWMAIWNKNIFFTIGIFILAVDLYKRRRWRVTLFMDKIPFFALGAVPVYILHSSTPYLKIIDRPAMGGSMFNTVLNDFSLLVQYLYHLVVPAPTYIWVNVFPVSSAFEVSGEAGLWAMRFTPLFNLGILLLFAAGILWLLKKHGLKMPFLFAVTSLVGLAPAMNIPPKWVEFAFRYDLILSAFYTLALVSIFGLAWMRWGRTGRRIIIGVLGCYLVWHMAQTLSQALDWSDEEKIVASCVRNFPDAKYCRARLARLYSRRYGPQKAISQFEELERLNIKPNNLRPSTNSYELARLYHRAGDEGRAIFYYERTLLRDPKNKTAELYLKKLRGKRQKQRAGPGQNEPIHTPQLFNTLHF